MSPTDTHEAQLSRGERFRFGQNWRRFLRGVTPERIARAEASLREMLGLSDLKGKRFVDVGCGSGLFSLAARQLGASVHSFDFDPQSVHCALDLKRQYFPDDPHWIAETGSALDADYLAALGRFDVVYSWGVLHHTGAMYEALGNVIGMVDERGKLFVSIYNDQGAASNVWRKVKHIYNRLPRPFRFVVLYLALLRVWGPTCVRDLVRCRPFYTWGHYDPLRGMSAWEDLVDWVGGYPFEVARPEEIFDFCKARGFSLLKLKTCGGGRGCNEFVFERDPALPEG